MTEALEEAQELIISREGSMTTLCLAVVADVTADGTTSKALCVISVGDSLAFVSSQKYGVKEVTVGELKSSLSLCRCRCRCCSAVECLP